MTIENKNICLFFKFGYCKFKAKCKKKHVTQVCDDEKCSQTQCEKRHPRLCKFFSNYGTCKLGNDCAYKHGKSKEYENLEKKMNEVLEKSREKDELIKDLIEDVKKLLRKNEEKDGLIKELVKEVKDLKVKANQDLIEDQEETTGREEVDDFVRASKKSLKLLDSMEADIKKTRKKENIKKKFKDHVDKVKEEMYSCDVALPSHLTFILNVIMGDFLWQKNHVDEKEDELEAIDSSRKEFKSFLNDPVKLSECNPGMVRA